jgi:polar amino acid transport system ATP-binding protein
LGGELTSNKPDWKAGLYFGTELAREHPDAVKPMHGPNLWHPKYPKMKDLVRVAISVLVPRVLTVQVLEYMERLSALGHLLMEAIARSLNMPPKFFYEVFSFHSFCIASVLI